MAGGLLLVLVVVLAVRLRSTVGPLGVDAWVARHLVGRLPGGHTEAGKPYGWIARFGAPGFVFVLTTLAVLWAVRRRDLLGGLLAVIAPGLALVLAEVVIKPVVARKINASDVIFVFPSGTVAVVVACVASTVVLVYRWFGRARATAAGVALGVIGLIVSVSVVEVGWHYATDAIGGLAVGGIAALAAARVLTPVVPQRALASPAETS
jgi:membrane-associated phospholipid phosphatase